MAPAEAAPPDPMAVAEARRALFRALSRPADEAGRFQYSFKELAAITSFAALVFSVAHYLPLPVFAGLAGSATVLAAFCDHLIPPRWRWLRGAWMCLAAGYVVAAISALVLAK